VEIVTDITTRNSERKDTTQKTKKSNTDPTKNPEVKSCVRELGFTVFVSFGHYSVCLFWTKKKDKRSNNNVQNTTQKTKDPGTPTPLKIQECNVQKRQTM
jgi:hypothetical protein